ncbi:Smr/MutS family protein [Synoicihabitans lomoniglobus]|uniref:Smr/MutS family protein n=1 Tax=Synoicihabitans lomoniglobus TaxID=2909285 RepID=A0AAF0CPC3_9BACT|nr:Smr/MutS family protein [Opitutaceae bacterium LMO-M01]WED63994.1 Smr/MutS family protein [Opitutaceae bacterium LMO-M01]
MDEEPPVEFPITGELDLHTFRPSDLGELIPAYLEACQAKGLTNVRIIHGKGTGTLRTTVHTLLDRHPDLVMSYRLGNETSGGWGATIATLNPTSASNSPPVGAVPCDDRKRRPAQA